MKDIREEAEKFSLYLQQLGYVKVVHGKWRDYPMRQLGFPAHIYTMSQCSVCEHAVENRTPYCPWCGAKMDGCK